MTSAEGNVIPTESATPAATNVGRWWIAVLSALVLAIPLGWLLSYGAALVALLGLYFFALFGIILGGLMYRIASPVRPIPNTLVIAGVTIVTLFCWGISMGLEVYEFPTDKADQAAQKVPILPDEMDVTDFKNHVATFVRDTLRENHGGSGFIGYARWVISSSRMELEVETIEKPIILQSIQYKSWWAFRVLASIAFMWFAIYAVVHPLKGIDDPAGAANPKPE